MLEVLIHVNSCRLFKLFKDWEVFEKNSENEIPPKMDQSKKVIVLSESASQELSNEWSCQ
jgi:hypothetical protein